MTVPDIQTQTGDSAGRTRRTKSITPARWSPRSVADQPLRLDCGVDLTPFQIAYQTYGELNAEQIQCDSWSAMR